MSECRVFWCYTCPICWETFPYGMFAGPQTKICLKCGEEKDVPLGSDK